MSAEKIQHSEIVEIFGDSMPVAAMKLLQDRQGTTSDLRAQLREVAKAENRRRQLALAAAAQASEATAELVRFAREGDNIPPPFGETEVVMQLADALKLAIDVEHHHDPDSLIADEERNQLYGALTKYIEGWAG